MNPDVNQEKDDQYDYDQHLLQLIIYLNTVQNFKKH